MSGAGTTANTGQGIGGTVIGPVFLTPSVPFRAIGPESPGGPSGGLYFVADVTESEEHRDELYITEHPIEAGANISDHAYKRPAQVQLRLGWSNSAPFNFDPYYINSIYLDLLKFQADRAPFTLYTGKRVYQNILMQSLVVETDETSEWALRVEMSLQQVFIVNTQTTTISSNPANQSNPQSSLPTTNNGAQTTTPPSALNSSSYNSVFTAPTSSPSNAQTIPIQTGASTVPLSSNTFPNVG
jgi:hypothetical protein